MVTYTTIELDHFNLTAEGNEIADTGSHEAKVFNAVDPVNGIAIAELAVNARGDNLRGCGSFITSWICREVALTSS